MHHPAFPDESQERELMELHEWLIKLEKLEIRRDRDKIPDREFQDECRSLLEESGEKIGIIQDRQIVTATSSLSSALGYTPEEIAGTPFSRYVHPDELPRLAKYYEQRLSGLDVPVIYETILKHCNSSNVYIKILTSLFKYLRKPANLAIIRILAETR